MKSQRSLRVSEVWVALLQIAKQNKVRCKLPCSPPSTTNAICIFIIFMDNQPKCKDSQKKPFVSWVDSMTSNPHFFNCYYTTLHDRISWCLIQLLVSHIAPEFTKNKQAGTWCCFSKCCCSLCPLPLTHTICFVCVVSVIVI